MTNQEAQNKTMNNVKKLTKDLFLYNYENDYYLNDLLDVGVKSVPELLKFATVKMLNNGNSFDPIKINMGCTTFNCKTPEGNVLLGRNFDFKAASCSVVWTTPESGYKSISVTNNNMLLYGKKNNPVDSKSKKQLLLAPYVPVDGLNEKGLAIAILELKHPPVNQTYDDRKDIVPTVMLRAVLDNCATIDEAIELFNKFNMNDSLFAAYHYQITDKSGRSVILEYDWTGEETVLNVYTPEDFGSKYGVQSCANFCVNNNIVGEKDFGHERAKLSFEAAEKHKGILTKKQAMDVLYDVRLSYKHEIYPWHVTTLWSAVYDCTDGKMAICAGLDYDNMYEFSVEKPYEYEIL
jgi:hypothetical protein